MKYFVTGGSGFVGRHLLLRLQADGHVVRALVTTDDEARVVTGLGATPVRADPADVREHVDELRGVAVVVHAAAQEGGPAEELVAGTRALLDAARAAGVRRFVHVSSDAVLAAGRPVRYVDETAPYPARNRGEHARTMALVEQTVLTSDSRELTTVAVRPRLVWGLGDTTVVPRIIAAAAQGRWAWVSGASHLTSTCHVRNLCEGIVLAARRGRGGQAYFLTDGPPVELRDFVARCAAAYGVALPGRTVPAPVTKTAAKALDTGWRVLPLKGEPPVAAAAVSLGVHEVTLDDTKARTELRYVPVVSVDEGIAELAEERAAAEAAGGGR